MISATMFHPRKRILKTKYISINIKKCHSCWKCIEVCPNDVLAKINFLAHHHVRLENPQNCTGCLRCKKVCSHRAITELE